MTEEHWYTAKEVSELLHIPTATVTQMWMNGKYPNAKIGENNVLLIPQGDFPPNFQWSKVPQQETPPDYSQLKEQVDEQVKKIRMDADKYAEETKTEAQAEADTIKKEVGKFKDEMMARLDDECAARLNDADKQVKEKLTALVELDEKTTQTKTELKDLMDKISLAIKKYNELRKATIKNRSYHYNLAMRDRWGRFQHWMGGLLKS